MKPAPRRLLPLLTPRRHGNRSLMTCRFRCGNACDHPPSNHSDNGYFGELFASRRGVLRAGSLGAIAIGMGASGMATSGSAFAKPGGIPPLPKPDPDAFSGKLSFEAVKPSSEDKVTVPKGYKHALLIEWGTPILPDAPEFDIDEQTAEAQKGQFGYNNDYLGMLPLNEEGTAALLACNHEYTNEILMFRDYTNGDDATVEQLEVGMAAHGMSIIEIRREKSGRWRTTMDAENSFSDYNRRIHLGTKFAFTGTAAGSDLLVTDADPDGTTPIGMQNNCSGGLTPWGTVLSGEENIDQYFVAADSAKGNAKKALERYSLYTDGHHEDDNRRFDRADERFDVSKHPHEPNRFGWIVEIDPYDPESVPRKHTAMGRLKHEGANPIVAPDGRVAAYMGDDEVFEYLYKFVSDKKYVEGDREHNMTLLESGTLYVAKLSFTSEDEIDGSGELPSDGTFDGSGEWLPLAHNDESFVDGFSAAEVLVHTRLAADAAGATKMDRPEDVEPNKLTGKIYAALTNNTDRGVEDGAKPDEANPRKKNKHGQVIEISEDDGDHTGTTFTWNLPIVCGDPEDSSTFFAGFDKSKVSPISCPDNVAFDASGKNLWITTDGNELGSNDGLYAVPLAGEDRGWLRQFASLPVGAETCGPFISGDNKTLFFAVQHPGEIDGATVDDPASVWPNGEYSKPGVVCVWHSDGEDIGR